MKLVHAAASFARTGIGGSWSCVGAVVVVLVVALKVSSSRRDVDLTMTEPRPGGIGLQA
jgi:hypothetical protein